MVLAGPMWLPAGSVQAGALRSLDTGSRGPGDQTLTPGAFPEGSAAPSGSLVFEAVT